VSEPGREVPGPGSKPAPKAVIRRVSLYLRQLESLARNEDEMVSSSRLGSALGINDAQVRKDLAYFGQFGQPGLGYRVEDLIATLRSILGIDRIWPTALIGLGNLGRALLGYKGFRSRGFRIVALFDNDVKKTGKVIQGIEVRHIDALPEVTREQGLRLAILCVPAEAAQRVADQIAAGGISGILNFAPTSIFVPEHVSVIPVDLSVQLEHLAYSVHHTQGDEQEISEAG